MDKENIKKLANFMVPVGLWDQFSQKYPGKASQTLRNLIKIDLNGLEGMPRVNRNDIKALSTFVFQDDRPVQVVGDVGIGKTTCMRKLIENNGSSHVFVVLDCHDEYIDLPEVQTITTDIKQSCRVRMPKQVSAARGLYPVYHNQILSQKYPSGFVIIIEESHRYLQIKELLKEARKFVKMIAVCQESLGSFAPMIKICV